MSEQLELELESRNYRLPRLTEDPRNSKGLLSRWIVDFLDMNDLDKPKGLSKRNYVQLLGMYGGMRQTYSINLDDIISQ
ncbi:MAG: hypothetical protein KKH88_02080 [Nanoarchaeota archaeon]|nr:hypothetical protein [Nanoarchaeota archaeon]